MANVFWRPDAAPASVVFLGAVPEGAGASLPLADLEGPARHAEEGLHMRLAGGLQVLFTGGAATADGLAVVLPLDAHFAARLDAAEALHRLLAGSPQHDDPLSRQRRRRLKRMLRAVDGQADGASYRDIAQHVLGEAFSESSAWRTSAARDVAIRLCRGATRLVRGGYLTLLRKRR